MDTSIYYDRMQKAVQYYGQELASLQIGRATRGLVENIKVPTSYGEMPMGQLANITTPDNQTIKIEVWDKTVLAPMEKAIYDMGTGLTPRNEGGYIIVKIPPLTGDRRKELVKQVHAMAEDIKARIRQTRHDAIKAIKALYEKKECSENEKGSWEKAIDEMTKKISTEIDTYSKAKEDDIMKQ